VRLQQPHVEDIMHASTLGQPKTIGNLSNAFKHLEWPSVARAKLTFGGSIPRGRGSHAGRAPSVV
jgi:hypothetical protein